MVLRCFVKNRLHFVVLVSLCAFCSLTWAKEFTPEMVRACHPPPSSQVSLDAMLQFKTDEKSKTKRSVEPIMTRGGASSFLRYGIKHIPRQDFDNGPMWKYIKVIVIMNLLGWLISLDTHSQLHIDLLGTGAFAAAALPTLFGRGEKGLRVRVSSAAVVIWGIKLAYFLFLRLILQGYDLRLADMMSTMDGASKSFPKHAIHDVVPLLLLLFTF